MMRMDAKASSGGADFAIHGRFDSDADVSSSTLNIPTDPVAYGGNSGLETDPEIIRSEMKFYSTPVTEKYSAAAYGAIRNIQAQCAADFQNVCPTESPYVSFNYLMDQLFAPMQYDFVFRRRKLTDTATPSQFRNGAEFVEYLRTLHAPRSLPELLHPLSTAMYRNEKTKTYVSPRADKSAPAPGKLSSKPRSYATAGSAVSGGATGHHVRVGDTHRHKQRRHLRNVMGALRPCGTTAADATPGWAEGADAGGSEGGFNSAAQSPRLDFSRLVLDFLNGRDLTLFLDSRSGALMPVGPAFPGAATYLSFAPVFSVSIRDDDAGDDAAYYYAADDDNGDDMDDDGELGAEDDYYAYDDARDDDWSAYYAYDDDDDDDDDEASAALPEGGGDDFYSPGPAHRLSAPLYSKGKATPCASTTQSDVELIEGGAGSDDYHSPGPAHSFTAALFAQKAKAHVPATVSSATLAATQLAQSPPPSVLLGSSHPLLRGWSVQGERGHEAGDGPDDSRHDHDHDHDRDGGHHRRGGDSGSSSSEEHEDHRPRPHPHGPPGPPPPPDHSFTGSLGYGAEGDSCLYRGIAQGRVSEPCIGAVADLYELRAQYWEESQGPSAHHCRGMLLLFALVGGALLGCLFRRWRTRKHRSNVRSLLTALHTHPALKASVEAETGISVPLPRPESACGLYQQGQADRCTDSRLARACKVLAAVAGLLVVSFAVSVTSLHITQHLVRYLDEHAPPDPETGDPQYTSVPAALLILLMVCTAQITLLTLAVRALRACCSEDKSSGGPDCAPYSTAGGATHVSPQPTTAGPVPVTEGAALWLQRHLQRLSSRWGRTSAGTVHDGYTMLPAGDEGGEGDLMLGQAGGPAGTEMVTFTAAAAARPSAPPVMVAQQVHAHHQHQPQGQPQGQHQQRYAAVLVPVTAMPVNTVSMV